MHKSICFLLFLASFLLPNHLFGEVENEEFVMIKELKKSLLIYDSKQKGYVPHAYETPFNGNAVSFILDPVENESLYLNICTQPNSALFIAQNIVLVQKNDECFLLSIDSLRQEYGSKEIFVTLYNKELDLKQAQIQIVKPIDKKIGTEKQSTSLEIVPRKVYPYKNFFIIGLLAILGLFAMVKRAYSKVFNEFYSISKIFSFRWREDSIIANRPISSANLMFLLLYSLVMAFIIQALWYETGAPSRFDFINLAGFSSSLSTCIFLSVLVFFVMIIKFIIIWITSTLLGFKDLVSFHFLDYIRISQLFLFFLLILVTLSTLSFKSFLYFNESFFVYIIGLCVLLTIILLFFKLLSTSTYRNVHLFSYLCTTEILPLIIGIKFFLNL